MKVQRTDGCWNWLGTLNGRGYGQFWDGKRLVRAHRWSYERHVAPIPDGMTIDHLCTNKACVRPDHLEAVSNGENTRRARKLNGVSPEILSCELNKFGVPVTLEYQETPLNRQNGEPRLL